MISGSIAGCWARSTCASLGVGIYVMYANGACNWFITVLVVSEHAPLYLVGGGGGVFPH